MLLYFSDTIQPEGSFTHAKLVKKGYTFVRLNAGHWVESSHVVVIELKNGDIVSVQSHDQGADYYGNDYSSFAGFLLYDYFDVINPVVGE